MNCLHCKKELNGRQVKYCSKKCKHKVCNPKYNDKYNQRIRGTAKKAKLVMEMGGCCNHCKYDKNLAVLNFHHINPETKSFSLDLRSFSGRKDSDLTSEAKKCIVLCFNCHTELHHPKFSDWKVVGPEGFEPPI